VALAKRANAPVAVFATPTVLLKSAPAPIASSVVIRGIEKERPGSDTCAEVAGDVETQ
jgi:hypothetical protein